MPEKDAHSYVNKGSAIYPNLEMTLNVVKDDKNRWLRKIFPDNFFVHVSLGNAVACSIVIFIFLHYWLIFEKRHNIRNQK